jgi:tetratricopeptide (TPR) repeat protein
MEFYPRALATDPQFPAAHFGVATLLVQLGRRIESLAQYRNAVSAWPDYAEARYNYGLALFAAGRPQAAAELAEASRLRPDDPEPFAARGKSLLALGRATEDADSYRQALSRSPDNVPAMVGLGVALAQTGHERDAIEQYTRALALDPNNAAAHNSLGTTLASQGRLGDALPHF